MDKEIFKYVSDNLSLELSEILKSKRSEYEKGLTIYEKALIYNYTDYGYESLNEQLRNKLGISDFGRLLNYSLDKLPNYNGLCYRAIKCSKLEIEKYYHAFRNDGIIIERTFLSCSKSRILALYFSESPLFIIKSKKGKDIEKISKFGIDNYGQNEKEILFKHNSKFKVLNITEDSDRIIIYLEEV